MKLPETKKKRIRKLLKNNRLSQREIAKQVGVSPYTVNMMAISSGLREKGTPSPRITREQKELMEYLLKTSNIKMVDIAKAVGVSYNTVRTAKKELNAPVGKNRKIKDIVKKVHSLNKKHLVWNEKYSPEKVKEAISKLENSTDTARDISLELGMVYDDLRTLSVQEKGEGYLTQRKRDIENSRINPKIVNEVAALVKNSNITVSELAKKYRVDYKKLAYRVKVVLNKEHAAEPKDPSEAIAILLDKDGKYLGVSYAGKVNVRIFREG